MDLPPAWCQVCVCGRMFSVPQAYTFHQHSLPEDKEMAFQRSGQSQGGLAIQEASNNGSYARHNRGRPFRTKFSRQTRIKQCCTHYATRGETYDMLVQLESLLHLSQSASVNGEDLDQPLAERRGRRENCQLPKRYQDILPAPPAALPPAPHPVTVTSECVPTASAATMQASPSSDQTPNIYSHVGKLLKSTRNKFGLFQQYHATCFPDHDPNENIMRDDLMDTSPGTFYPPDSYHPYPNQSSFLLGEWYWTGGLKKTQSGFQDLIKIVGHPNFQLRMFQGQTGGILMCSWVEIGHATPQMKRTGRMKRIMATGLKPQSRSRSHSTKGCCIQGKRSSMQEPFITASWCQWLGGKSCVSLAIHTSISSRMSYFGNRLKLLNQSKFTENSTPQRHSSRLTVTFRNLLESRGVTF
jgi:hypothetical protein